MKTAEEILIEEFTTKLHNSAEYVKQMIEHDVEYKCVLNCMEAYADQFRGGSIGEQHQQWVSVEERPLFELTENGWVTTKDGDNPFGFMAALQYSDSSNNLHWWVKHCIIENETGLCVVGDDSNEPAGWDLQDVTHWSPITPPTAQP